MCRYWLLLCLLFCLTIPLHAQDNPSPYDFALQRIQEAAESGATVLDLSRLGLTELPSEISQLPNLQGLNLDHNQLTNLPPEIGQLTNLLRLLLNNNQLTSLPSSIGQLHTLYFLHLHQNQLTSLPPEIGQLSRLERLSLSDNQLTSLPHEIGQLTNLQRLLLTNNQLTSLPSSIGQLSELHILSLDGNQLRHLPYELGNITYLACAECYLVLDNNPLISPPPEVVEHGTAAVLAYLRNQAGYHVQRLIIGAAWGVGLLAAFVLGLRYRRTRDKSKAKRG